MATPLTDRLQSNSPDPPANWLPRSTTPLRIIKRESSPQSQLPPQRQLARRQSSSYNHVRNNNLVSKSPFKSQIPTSMGHTPSPRRVSGEKRPRPTSMQTHENERPLGFKRRQSKAFQGLLEKEPVTKSPFKSRTPQSNQVPPVPSVPSPARSALVSKRLHGPRNALNGTIPPRRQRRKTVTFDERCDVVEFDVDEDQVDEDAIDSDGESEHVLNGRSDDSFEDEQQGDDSVEGWINEVLSDEETPHTPRNSSILAVNANSEGPQTPHNSRFLGVNPDAEDGVPYGRTHHIQRAVAAHHRLEDLPTSITAQSSSPISSSPASLRAVTPESSTPPPTHVPLGRSSHAERVQAQRQEATELEQDVQMLPPSPSPARRDKILPSTHTNRDSLLPHFPVHVDRSEEDCDEMDPFAVAHPKDDSVSFDVAGNPDQSASSMIIHDDLEQASEEEHILPPDSAPPSRSPSPTGGIDASATDHVRELADEDTPIGGAPAESSAVANGEQSFDLPAEASSSPVQEQESSGKTTPLDDSFTKVDNLPYELLALNRQKHLTYSGIVAIEPEPQLNDPPRPSRISRHHTTESFGGSDHKGAFDGLELDFERGFALGDEGMSMAAGLNFGVAQEHQMNSLSALDRLVEDVASSNPALSVRRSVEGFRIEAVTDGIRATRLSWPTDLPTSETGHIEQAEVADVTDIPVPISAPAPAYAPDLMPSVSRTVSNSSIPPPPPPKDNIRAREELIKAKKREARRRAEEEEGMDVDEEVYVQKPGRARSRERSPARPNIGIGLGRPSRRRSMSVGDAEDLLATRPGAAMRRASALKNEVLLDVGPIEESEAPLADSIDHELKKLSESPSTRYHVREREVIYVASDSESVSHINGPGDVDSGKAWRTVKRPSDMNEYAKQIRELRAQAKPGKTHGKVFVRVMGLKKLMLPLPHQPTIVTCTLNNGIHFVTTPECRLSNDCKIDQEFELIEHSKLEFTLTIKVRRDPHIIAQFKANAPRPAPAPPRTTPPPASKGGGMRAFFLGSSSPKKPSKVVQEPAVSRAPAPPLQENLARYLKQDGTLGRAFISFKDIAKHCDTKLFETTYQLIGQKSDHGPTPKTMQVGEIVLQIFRLPPLPGVPSEQLPQSLEECHRGLRNVSWHKLTYFEGTLTQNGGDCTSWRRRQLRVIGANLVAFNDVTKRAMATIDLRKAIAVEDDRDEKGGLLSPDSRISQRSRYSDDCDGPYGVERSFRLVFPRDQEIIFFADTDEEKMRWLEVLRALVGRIPPNPLWAEMLWQRQQEHSRSATSP